MAGISPVAGNRDWIITDKGNIILPTATTNHQAMVGISPVTGNRDRMITDKANFNLPTATTNHQEMVVISPVAGNRDWIITDKANFILPTATTNRQTMAGISPVAEMTFLAMAKPIKVTTKSLGPMALLQESFLTTTTLRPFTKPSSGTNPIRKDTNTGQAQEFTPTT
jgi:hypothetical protein